MGERCVSAKSRRGAVVCRRVLTWAHVSSRKDNAVTRLHDPDAMDPPIGEFSASELGAMLREARMSQGRELEAIADELRIRLVYLQAIEEGHLEELPGITYATGFLRAYGDFLGLDGVDLVRRFKAAGMAMAQATDLHLPSPVEEGRLPTGSVLLVAALLAVGAYGGWYYMSSQGRDPIENVAELPVRLAELVGIDGEIDGEQGTTAGSPNAESSNTAAAAGDPEMDRTSESTTASLIDTAGDAATPGVEGAPEPMATTDATDREDVASSPVVSAASADDAVPVPGSPAGGTGEIETDQVASASGKTEPTPAAPPPVVARAVSQEPPAAPKRKPILVERMPAPTATSTAATVSADTTTDAPAATTIVAAATNGDPPAAGRNALNVASATAPPANHRVVLRAKIDTWVEVAAAEGVPVLSRLMREGETFVVPSRPGLMMTTGNAGGIDILIDGKAIPQLGPVGEIRTNIVLDAQSLLDGRIARP